MRTYAALALLAATAVALVPPAPRAHAAPAAMVPVATVALPNPDGGSTSSILAFDGDVFYYSSAESTANVVRRARLVGSGLELTAVALPPLTLGITVLALAYDARHDALVVQDPSFVYRYAARTHRLEQLFMGFAHGYDWPSDHFVEVQSNVVTTVDARGNDVRRCWWPSEEAALVPSAYVGSGDGEVYVQMEDDSTVYRIGLDCAMRGTFVHRTIAEGAQEDDSLACDGVTFGRPVLWLRDTATTTMTAYALPSGSCVLPTALSMRASRTGVCATLHRPVVATPLPAQPVVLRVDGGDPLPVTTDTRGVACAAVVSGPGRHVAAASYAGSSAWARSAAKTRFVVPAGTPRALARPPAARRGPDAVRDAVPPVPDGGVAAPPPAPPLAPGPQAAAQQAYSASSAAQGLPGAVPVPETQRQGEVVYAMTDLGAEHRRSAQPLALLLGAAAVTAVATVALRRGSVSAVRARGRP